MTKPFGIIGDGRVARHFRHYFALLGVPTLQWSRRLEREQDLQLKSLAPCESLLILIRDGEIVPFIESEEVARSLPGDRNWIHFSGALSTSKALGFHPLMTFGAELYSQDTYETIPFIGEESASDPKRGFAATFPILPNPYFQIPADSKALYHSLCVMAGNFTVILWQKLFTDFEARLGIPRSAAIPYLRQIAKNLEENPDRSLTGPIQRRDLGTIERNLKSLGGDPFEEIYRSFARAFVPEAKFL